MGPERGGVGGKKKEEENQALDPKYYSYHLKALQNQSSKSRMCFYHKILSKMLSVCFYKASQQQGRKLKNTHDTSVFKQTNKNAINLAYFMTVYYIYIYYIRAGERLQQKKTTLQIKIWFKMKKQLIYIGGFSCAISFLQFYLNGSTVKGEGEGKKKSGRKKETKTPPSILGQILLFLLWQTAASPSAVQSFCREAGRGD